MSGRLAVPKGKGRVKEACHLLTHMGVQGVDPEKGTQVGGCGQDSRKLDRHLFQLCGYIFFGRARDVIQDRKCGQFDAVQTLFCAGHLQSPPCHNKTSWGKILCTGLAVDHCRNCRIGQRPVQAPQIDDLHHGLGRLVFIFFFVAILSWTTMASAVSKAMAGSRWIQWLLRLGILAVSLPLIYFHSKGMITPAQYIVLIIVFCCGVGLYCSSRTILAFYKARKKLLIGDRTIYFAAIGWIVLCFVSVYSFGRLFGAGSPGNRLPQEFIPVYSVIFMLAGLLMLPFAPLATAPLALAKSRSH